MGLGCIAAPVEFGGDERTRGVNMPDAVIGYVTEDAVDEVIDTTHLAQPERGRDVLGLDMKSRRDRFADLMAERDGSIRHKERRIYVHHIRPSASLADEGTVGIAVEEIMLLAQELEHREMEDTGAIVAVGEVSILFGFGLVAAKHAYLMSALAQLGSIPLRRDARAVVGRIERVDNE